MTTTRKKSWNELTRSVATIFRRWHVTNWNIAPVNGPPPRNRYHSQGDRNVKLVFVKNGRHVALHCNSESLAHDNLQVLALAIEAMRMNENNGTDGIVVSGYRQLYPGSQPAQEQKTVDEHDPYAALGVDPHYPLSVIETIWKARLRVEHPDAGGSEVKAKRLNAAMAEIRRRREA